MLEHLKENYKATGTRTYMPDHITDDYELWQDELNEILEKAKSVDENFYNDMKQQSMNIVIDINLNTEFMKKPIQDR